MFNTLKPCLKLFEFMFEIIGLEHSVTINTNIYRKNILDTDDPSDDDDISDDNDDISDDDDDTSNDDISDNDSSNTSSEDNASSEDNVSSDDILYEDESDDSDDIQWQLEKLDIDDDIYIIRPSRKNNKSRKKIRLNDINLLLSHMFSQVETIADIKAPEIMLNRWLGIREIENAWTGELKYP